MFSLSGIMCTCWFFQTQYWTSWSLSRTVLNFLKAALWSPQNIISTKCVLGRCGNTDVQKSTTERCRTCEKIRKFQEIGLGNSVLTCAGIYQLSRKFVDFCCLSSIDLNIVGDLYARFVRLCSIPDCIPVPHQKCSTQPSILGQHQQLHQNLSSNTDCRLILSTAHIHLQMHTIQYNTIQFNTIRYSFNVLNICYLTFYFQDWYAIVYETPEDGASMPKHVAVSKTCVQLLILLSEFGGEFGWI